MARILYGVMGNTHGHIMRSLALATSMPEHEFHFVGGGKVPAAVEAKGYPCLEVPVLRTVHKKQRIDIPAIAGQIAGRIIEIPGVLGRIQTLIRDWKPDMAICDREFYTPLACRRARLPCLAVNHSGLLLSTHYPVARGQRWPWFLTMLNDRLLFDFTRENWSVSYYHPALRRPDADRLFPPVLRPEVMQKKASEGDYILVYQTSNTFSELIEALRLQPRKAVIYGFSQEERIEGHLHFKPYSFTGILEDLAACSYAIVNGGHNLICEALYYHKPVLCFPIRNLFEQFLNAYYLRELGYGDFSLSMRPDPEIFAAFEENRDRYQQAIRTHFREGTEELVAALRERIGRVCP